MQERVGADGGGAIALVGDREHDDRHLARVGVVLEDLDQRQPVDVGHAQIDGDEIGLLLARDAERLIAVVREIHFVAGGDEHALQDVGGVAIVVDDEHAARRRRRRARLGRRLGAGGRGVGQGDDEARAFLVACAFDPDAPAVALDDAARDGEAETGAADLARVRRLDLLELVEDALAIVGGDGDAVVPDRQPDEAARHLGAEDVDLDAPALGRELDGVGQQVVDDLREAIGVGDDADLAVGGRAHAEHDVLLLAGGAEALDRLARQHRQIERAHAHRQLAALHLGHVQ